MDKTKILKTNMESFRVMKDLESDIQNWKKIADDWKKTAEALAIDLGKVEYAQTTYEDIADGLYDTVRERMLPDTNASNAFDGIYDYAMLISQKIGDASEFRIAAEDAASSDYYYWDGYIEALDFAIDSLPNYNN